MFRSRKVAIAAVALLPVVAGGALLQTRATRSSTELFDQVLQLVGARFVDTLDSSALYEKAARGLVEELNDPYSELLSPKDVAAFQRTTGGRYGGIGMLIEQQNDAIVVSTVYPNTPAEQKGIRPGDRIVKVDTALTRGWKTQQVSDAILGTPGTKVNVSFSRPGVTDPFTVSFTRATIHIPAVPYAIMLEGKIGYLPLQRFNETASEEVQSGVQRLVKDGAKAVILDVRGNPGGILEQSLQVSNLFLKNGQELASVRGRGGEVQRYQARGQTFVPDMPLVVLTDEYSASASEIVAGALQDHDRALVVGQTTWGKGLVQSVFNLDGGYALKLTTAKWFTPSGRSIQRERKVVNGRFVEEQPDTNETEAERKAKPAFKSDAGRIVYGGGGVTPDVLVNDDTLTTAQQALNKALVAKQQEVYTTLADYALELARQVNGLGFTLNPEWRAEFQRRLQAKGVQADAATWQSGAPLLDRLLEQRLARQVGGDSTVRRRSIKDDAPLRKAIELLNRGQSQRDLFTLAAAEKTHFEGADKSVSRLQPAPTRKP